MCKKGSVALGKSVELFKENVQEVILTFFLIICGPFIFSVAFFSALIYGSGRFPSLLCCVDD